MVITDSQHVNIGQVLGYVAFAKTILKFKL